MTELVDTAHRYTRVVAKLGFHLDIGSGATFERSRIRLENDSIARTRRVASLYGQTTP